MVLGVKRELCLVDQSGVQKLFLTLLKKEKTLRRPVYSSMWSLVTFRGVLSSMLSEKNIFRSQWQAEKMKQWALEITNTNTNHFPRLTIYWLLIGEKTCTS